jgi:hypothetical protein
MYKYLYINKPPKKQIKMGCGCKGNNPPPPSPQTAQSTSQGTQPSQGTQQRSSLQESVKNTITKYYRVNKTGR